MLNPAFLYSPRLLYIAATPGLLRAELNGTNELASILNVAIPSDWPPGEYDQDAMQFFLDQLVTGGPDVAGWYNWYVVAYPTGETQATLVAGAGYFGPPNSAGVLEIGYSVSAEWQRRGIATELVATLVRQGWQHPEVNRIMAHTLPNNVASIGVLNKNGFHPTNSDDPEKLCFELFRQA